MTIPLVVSLLLLAQSPLTVTITDDPLADATKFVTQVNQTLPAWEADTLAQYERPELAAVKKDVARGMGDTVEDDFLEDEARLERDWSNLVALDKALQRNNVL